jgi:uncharacterized protein involved in response to NO
MNTLLATGFRPFFLGASLCALLAMLAWTLIYAGAAAFPIAGLPPSAWHAHEMLYGYAMAVIAGFLLTAARNWTGLRTAEGTALGALVFVWAAARVLLLVAPAGALPVAAALDLLFQAALAAAVARPILLKRQWRQAAILSKLVLLTLGNALFYAGAMGLLDEGVRWSLYGGFYLVIALILTMGRRLIPFFTERGVGAPVTLGNSKLLDLASLALLVVFWVAEVFVVSPLTAAVSAGALALVNARRLVLWYTPGILARPLLWSLHLSFAMLVLGFGLRALAPLLPPAPLLALHLLAIGGIALVTVSMMARVSLGHTGRSVHEPPRVVLLPIALLLAAALLRVAGPLAAPAHYAGWVLASQVAWLAAFAVFTVAWWPVLTRPRVDGAPG